MKHKRSYIAEEMSNPMEEINRLKARGAGQEHYDLWRKTGLMPGMNVLDLGCGPGVFTTALAKYVENGQVTGIDASQLMITEAKKTASDAGVKNVTFKRLELQSNADFGREFDYIWARLIFQHISHPEDVMKVCLDSLKPGGRLCIVDADRSFIQLYPESKAWKELADQIAEKQMKQGGDPYVGRKLASYLQRAGYSDINVEYSSSIVRGKKIALYVDYFVKSLIELYGDPYNPISKQALRELADIQQQSDAYLYHILFVVTAKKSG